MVSQLDVHHTVNSHCNKLLKPTLLIAIQLEAPLIPDSTSHLHNVRTGVGTHTCNTMGQTTPLLKVDENLSTTRKK